MAAGFFLNSGCLKRSILGFSTFGKVFAFLENLK
jgi:hypothetical protein